jgi:hypothetical protein
MNTGRVLTSRRTLTTLTVSLGADADRGSPCEPVTFGLPIPRGLLQNANDLSLIDEDGIAVPLQARITEQWPDESVRWLLLDLRVEGEGGLERRYELRAGAPSFVPASTLRVSTDGASTIVDTGVGRFVLRTGRAFPFAEATAAGASLIDAAASRLTVTGESGAARDAVIERITVEETGSERCAIRLDAVVGSRRRPLLRAAVRLHFFRGSAAVRAAVTLHNPRRAQHPGGYWELGDRGSVHVRDASLVVALPGAAGAVDAALEAGAPPERFEAPFELYQDSSGGERWQHATHVNRHGRVPCRLNGYTVASKAARRSGRRATPAVVVRHSGGRTGVSVEHFWQNFPQAIEARESSLTLRMLPRQFSDVHELQGGEQKTWRFVLAFGDDALACDAIFWGRSPAAAAAVPEWYADAQAVPYLSPAADDCDGRYRRLIDAAIEGDDAFEAKRERIDQFGWRNFGDLYADHENAFSGEPAPIVSHYNNQYDAVGGFARQFMRTADARWLQLMNALARHVNDIDIYHTDRDKAAYNHGLFWHTAHYVPAGKSSHRSYPRDPRVGGGGPANEHNYTAGLRLHWLLTGDPQSRDSAIGLAQWVVDMDDGRKNVLGWLSRGYTGLASQTRGTDFHGPGRGAGHSILALIDGHRLAGEPRFLAKAEQLIRRCVHPEDDIPALNLLDAEARWSYVVFLQALGAFLDYKTERSDFDSSYCYARDALLQYARWMAGHEYPYLSKPEILEYPTETWAAQDIRKSDVFLFAAAHTQGDERARFLERADFFFDSSLNTLLESATRALTRPVVLLLSNGVMYFGARRAAERSAASPDRPHGFGEPASFEPQRTTAKRRLAAAAAVFVAIGTAACIALL